MRLPSLFRARSLCPKRDSSTVAGSLQTFPEKHFSFLLTAIPSDSLFCVHVSSIVTFTFRNCFVCDWEYKGGYPFTHFYLF